MSKSPSLRRIQADIRELALDPSDRYYAAPLENDMFEWHFTIRGADGTDFEGGIYHGRILLPPEYPFKPPHIMFLTPSGRFETNTKICLSFSAFHPELWQPAWGIRLILEALISFLPTPADGAIGALDWTPEERKRLAKQSVSFVCPHCGPIKDLIPKIDPSKKKNSNNTNSQFAKQIQELQRLQLETEGNKNKNKNNIGKDKNKDQNTNKNDDSNIDNNKQQQSHSQNSQGTTITTTTTTTDNNQESNHHQQQQPITEPTETGTKKQEDQASVEPKNSTTTASAKLDSTEAAVGVSSTPTAPTTQDPIGPASQLKDPPSDNSLPMEAALSTNVQPPPEPAIAPTTTTTTTSTTTTIAQPKPDNHEPLPEETMELENEPQQLLQQQQQNEQSGFPWDPLLQGMIVLLAIICYLFIRKWQQLLAELDELEEQLKSMK